MPLPTKEERAERIAKRDALVKEVEKDLRERLKFARADIQQANIQVCKGSPAVSYRATEMTKAVMLQLLQDRITELCTNVNGVHRY